ncbi:hypothetical protein HY493_01385 [Candidatus Woesearchaeota archaeon]|nr:hypothetical protein [Candidatus Woesearchaeota archaeon]
MELTITGQKENALLQRKDVTATLSFDKATPSNAEVAKALAAKLSTSEDTIVVKRIEGGFGTTSAKVHALVYASAEQKLRIEPKKKAKKVEGAPAPAAK